MQTQLTKLMNHVSSLELDKEAQKESKVSSSNLEHCILSWPYTAPHY